MAGVFVSFDWEHDRRYKHLLQGWHQNPRFSFTFNDASSGEIKSNDIGRVKAALTTKIRAASFTLVIVGEYANSIHPDRVQIGFRNWINFEVRQSVDAGNRIAAVKLDRTYTSPEELTGVGASWAMRFSEPSIIRALEQA